MSMAMALSQWKAVAKPSGGLNEAETESKLMNEAQRTK